MPKDKVQSISSLLAELKRRCGDQVTIDVEVNSLEDAFINIAHDEERLMALRNGAEHAGNLGQTSSVNQDEESQRPHHAALENNTDGSIPAPNHQDVKEPSLRSESLDQALSRYRHSERRPSFL